MFKHILVPLDGSHLAEAALKPTAEISQKLGASVTLIHVIEKDASAEVHGDHHLTGQDEACAYLARLAEQAFPPEIDVDSHVHTEEVRDVARSITDHSVELSPDLIVMCTHGHGGLREMMAGSIAQQVIGMGKTPVLLLQPDEAGGVFFLFNRFLVALDASREHEASLEVAGGFAQGLGAALHLVNVVQTPETLSGDRAAASRLLPGTSQAMLEMEEEFGREYLNEKAAIWRAKGLQVTARVRRGDVAKELAAEVARADCHLIVLGTHGRSGIDAFWSGSTAPKIVGHMRIPLLLVPVNKVD
jgi:nucleotide-binding universal stress UspA family protein